MHDRVRQPDPERLGGPELLGEVGQRGDQGVDGARQIPLDQLLHKVVMIRDRLRVLEQKINANPKLTDAEKVDMQAYITGCYGSLTTFNVLFRDREDGFIGSGGKEKG